LLKFVPSIPFHDPAVLQPKIWSKKTNESVEKWPNGSIYSANWLACPAGELF
jgi:hypothetical protein